MVVLVVLLGAAAAGVAPPAPGGGGGGGVAHGQTLAAVLRVCRDATPTQGGNRVRVIH